MKTTVRQALWGATLATIIGGWGAAGGSHAQTLIHHYEFNSNANDSVGTANGTLENGATVSGGVLSLDGANDFVQFGEKIVPFSGSYSVTLFAQQTTLQTGIVEFISQGFSGGPGFYIGHAGDQIRVTDSWASTGITFPNDLVQHHYALTVDSVSNSSLFYIDGILRGTNAAISTTSGGTNTRLGRQFEPFAEFFAGQLDDVRIYTGALSAQQVGAIASGSITAAPEPGTLGLLGLGILPLLAARMRRRRA